MRNRTPRAIGPLGTVGRIVLGASLVASAFVFGQVHWSEAALGLVVFPAVLVAAHLIRLRFSPAPLRATGPVGHCANCALLALLFAMPATREATLLWLGASLLLAAWRGYAGCESLAVSNWLLRRDDQVGCLILGPVDALEARLADRAGRRSRPAARHETN